jgi:hypothetical protein
MTKQEIPGTKIMNKEHRPGAALCAAVAEELQVAKQQLEELAAVVIADERFILQYLDQLQSFDMIVQHIDESATLLSQYAKGREIECAVNGVRLTSVQERLRAALA